jgi:hypothetical protein
MRLRSILRKRRGLEGRGRGKDHHRGPNRYFEKLGLLCLLDARETEIASFPNRANRWLESRMREIRTSASEGGAGRDPRSYLHPGGRRAVRSVDLWSTRGRRIPKLPTLWRCGRGAGAGLRGTVRRAGGTRYQGGGQVMRRWPRRGATPPSTSRSAR